MVALEWTAPVKCWLSRDKWSLLLTLAQSWPCWYSPHFFLPSPHKVSIKALRTEKLWKWSLHWLVSENGRHIWPPDVWWSCKLPANLRWLWPEFRLNMWGCRQPHTKSPFSSPATSATVFSLELLGSVCQETSQTARKGTGVFITMMWGSETKSQLCCVISGVCLSVHQATEH